ncbi:MAG TPA: DNA topoisomerase [Tenuifilaceae bacterium]|nr:DNA topoisomerase [Tenuifilaceae bacterium]
MKLIITEKPSVAQDFAKALGNGTKREGYIDCGDYCITWAFGHILKVDDSQYNTGDWSIESLPILPKSFSYTPIGDKKGQLNTITNLLKRCDNFIVATDAGREGELIAREIIMYAKANPEKGLRFWSSEALTEEVIVKGMKNLKPLTSYDSLFYAAYARQISDWIVGVNFTRFFSILAKEMWSVGRVQTPTLALIVKRFNDIENFTPQKFFTVTGTAESQSKSFECKFLDSSAQDNKERFDEATSSNIVSTLLPLPFHLKCTDKTKEIVKKNPPLLHSLTSLQREANRTFGYTAQQTLDIAQSLYESHKCISYPRSDSNHLAESSFNLASEKLDIFKENLDVDVNRPGKRVFDTSKLTDHHAIIPLNLYNGSKEEEKNVFELILATFLAAFMKPYTYEETVLTFSTPLNNIVGVSRGKILIDSGYRVIFHENEESDVLLPPIEINQNISLISCVKNQKFTEPPKKYTDDSILAIMEKNNLGTPATRASILERLFKVGYLIREKKNIIPTEKGIELIILLITSNCPLFQTSLTSTWENDLENIYKQNEKKSGYDRFVNEISSFTTSQIVSLIQQDISISTSRQATPDMLKLANKIAKEKNIKDYQKGNTEYDYIKDFISQHLKSSNESPCPCGGTIFQDKYYYFCQKCNRKIQKELSEKQIGIETVSELFAGREVKVKGFKSKKGTRFDAAIFLDSAGKVQYKFDK